MVKYSSRTLNRTFAALADPTRRRILAHLARGDKCVTHLAKSHAMSLPAVSKHLRVLEKAGLLRRRRYGRVHEMQLDAKPLREAARDRERPLLLHGFDETTWEVPELPRIDDMNAVAPMQIAATWKVFPCRRQRPPKV